jgi:hypothetical protein
MFWPWRRRLQGGKVGLITKEMKPTAEILSTAKEKQLSLSLSLSLSHSLSLSFSLSHLSISLRLTSS